jgi:hypothetical protein
MQNFDLDKWLTKNYSKEAKDIYGQSITIFTTSNIGKIELSEKAVKACSNHYEVQVKELEHKYGLEKCSLYAEIGMLKELLKEAWSYRDSNFYESEEGRKFNDKIREIIK